MKALGQRWVDAIEPSGSITEWVPYVNEISTGSKIKYALDKSSGLLLMHRAMEAGLSYPTNYGFVPHTLAKADGMEIDLLALSTEPLLPLTIAKVRLVGGCTIHSGDESSSEDKLLGVAVGDPGVEAVIDINHVDAKMKARIEEFFSVYKDDEAIETVVERWFDRVTAIDKIRVGLKAAKKAEKKRRKK
jgi:inorganic pyrophosphatase